VKARRAWLLANRIANCDCFERGTRMAPITAITRWVVKHEYWSPPLVGHLLAASLMLDGIGVEELP
jgi:hypothetical protein